MIWFNFQGFRLVKQGNFIRSGLALWLKLSETL